MHKMAVDLPRAYKQAHRGLLLSVHMLRVELLIYRAGNADK